MQTGVGNMEMLFGTYYSLGLKSTVFRNMRAVLPMFVMIGIFHFYFD